MKQIRFKPTLYKFCDIEDCNIWHEGETGEVHLHDIPKDVQRKLIDYIHDINYYSKRLSLINEVLLTGNIE